MQTCTILINNFMFSPFLSPPLPLSSLLPETTDHLGIEFMGKEAFLVLNLHESRLLTSQGFILDQPYTV